MKRRARRAAWKAVCKRRGLPPGVTAREAWQQYRLEPTPRRRANVRGPRAAADRMG